MEKQQAQITIRRKILSGRGPGENISPDMCLAVSFSSIYMSHMENLHVLCSGMCFFASFPEHFRTLVGGKGPNEAQ